jgi:Tfp pilus assembly pilus retraction ATPase PilT
VVVPLGEDPLDGHEIEGAVLPAPHRHALKTYRATGSTDTSLRRQGMGRFRINLHHERGSPAATVRALPANPPCLADLALPVKDSSTSRKPGRGRFMRKNLTACCV